MDPVEADVFAVLTGQTAAGDRVYPLVRGQGTPLPALVYTRTGSAPVTSLAGSSGLDQVRVQVDCYAASYAAAKALAAEVRQLLEGASFKALLQTDFDFFEPDTQVYRVTQDYYCWQK